MLLKNITRRVFVVFATVIVFMSISAVSVSAAEITPDADSYSYGSTSEMSATASSSTGSDVLADTGANEWALPLALSLIVLGGGAVFYALSSKKELFKS